MVKCCVLILRVPSVVWCFSLDGLSKKKDLKHRYDETSNIYDDRYKEIQKTKFKSIKPFLKEMNLVLDMGCGTGLFLNEFSKYANRVVGIDISLGMLEKARKRSGETQLITADADSLPFKNETFDAVISLTLLQNMPSPKQTVKEAKRIMVKGGLLMLTTLKQKHSVSEIEEWINSANLKSLRMGRIPDSEDILCVARKIE